jgi:hypothetical protein
VTDPVHGYGWNTAERWGGWHWEDPRGAEHFRRCSFCGSVSPDDLAAEPAGSGCGYPGCPDPQNELAQIHFPVEGMAGKGADDGCHLFVNTGWRASWADRKYGWPHKFYVEGVVNRNPGILRVITVLSPGQEDRMERETGYQWHPAGEIPAGTDVSGWRLEDGRYSHVGLGSDRTHFVKFYTVHLADPALSAEAKKVIEKACGLHFTFEDGRVGWEAWQAA